MASSALRSCGGKGRRREEKSVNLGEGSQKSYILRPAGEEDVYSLIAKEDAVVSPCWGVKLLRS